MSPVIAQASLGLAPAVAVAAGEEGAREARPLPDEHASSLGVFMASMPSAGTAQEGVIAAEPAETDRGPEGIGGWLILPAIGLVLSPLLMLYMIITELLPLFAGDGLAVLTTPGTEAYHPLWGPLLTFELVANTLLVAAFVITAVVFFTRRAAAPLWMVGLYVGRVLLQFIDHALGSEIPAVAASEEGGTTELIRSSIQAMIWIPYFLTSKRVKNTFTR